MVVVVVLVRNLPEGYLRWKNLLFPFVSSRGSKMKVATSAHFSPSSSISDAISLLLVMSVVEQVLERKVLSWCTHAGV